MEIIRKSDENHIKFIVVYNYVERMSTSELIYWWNRGVVVGHTIVDAFKNYFNFRISEKYAKMIKDKGIRVSKRIINDELNMSDLIEKEKQELKNC
nr:SAGA-associated factor 73-like [Ipomoea trifida]